MQGIIGIEQLQFFCFIGIEAHEKMKKQPLILDLKIKTNFKPCRLSDQIQDTINYIEISDLCVKIAKKNHYQLLESLASDILEIMSENYPISWAWIRIQKPEALSSARSCYVELEWPFLSV